MGIKQRSEKRRKRIVAYRAKDFKDAEHWDLKFWQSQSADIRLSALIAIRNDIKKVLISKKTKSR